MRAFRLRAAGPYLTAICLCTTLACARHDDDSAAAADSAATNDSAANTPMQGQVISPPSTTFDSTVDWSRIQEVLRYETSKVSMVTEGRNRKVSVRMKDGRLYQAVEPSAAAIIRLTQEIDKTGSIMVVAE